MNGPLWHRRDLAYYVFFFRNTNKSSLKLLEEKKKEKKIYIFFVITVKHWNLLPWHILVSIFVEVQNPTVQRPEQPALVDCFEQQVGLDKSSSPFQHQLFCDSMKTSIRKQQKNNRITVKHQIFF